MSYQPKPSETFLRVVEAAMSHGGFLENLPQIRFAYRTMREKLPNEFENIIESAASKRFLDHDDEITLIRNIRGIINLQEKLTKFQFLNDEEGPTFSVSPDEREQILGHCVQMRKIIHASTVFDNAHKVRLLNRIDEIEKQVLKEEGLFDVVRGGMNDLGETLGKFGTEIKPLTDRMKEVVEITRRKTKAYDALPSEVELKKLPPPEDEEPSEE